LAFRTGYRGTFSRADDNRRELVLACPITSNVRGYQCEVLIPAIRAIAGALAADHAQSIEWRARNAEPIGTLQSDVIENVYA